MGEYSTKVSAPESGRCQPLRLRTYLQSGMPLMKVTEDLLQPGERRDMPCCRLWRQCSRWAAAAGRCLEGQAVTKAVEWALKLTSRAEVQDRPDGAGESGVSAIIIPVYSWVLRSILLGESVSAVPTLNTIA